MKKKLLFIFALLCTVAQGAWAATIDLSTVTEATTVQNGDVLTGKLASNVKISIAADATITLDGASINTNREWTEGDYAGLTCLGNATIILQGENTVKGFNANYPGIQPAKYDGEGKYTLTIQGSGSLNASSNGTGTGIGSGHGGGCGDITIANTVTSVTATKGTDAYNSIGKGYESVTCGTITIGGTEYWEWYEGYGWKYEGIGDELLHKTSLVYLKANADGNGNYWTTYYSDANHYQAPEGTQVFKVALDDTKLTLGKIESGIVNSDEGVVLKSTSANYFLTSTTSSPEVLAEYEGNSLEGIYDAFSESGEVEAQVPDSGWKQSIRYKRHTAR